ncbi:LOW QUALITY PROTEIN: neuritin-like protein [Hippopotamus amphibius kiboko]|uniref:LOW QUALITY PROTEIN: neuritin-like protein n=1 Tax=Hippopotamus amphibius kiboko TaxID=575201 RepID=UPI002599A218|nr:LOW QUALITY PROTEIN: neuritin-like protein [Hippopotamus amphibius kiboko]
MGSLRSSFRVGPGSQPPLSCPTCWKTPVSGEGMDRVKKACLGCRETALPGALPPSPHLYSHLDYSCLTWDPEARRKSQPLGQDFSFPYPNLSCPVLVSPLAAATAGPGRCDTIYQGFAKCLIRLGDGMGHGGELETVCRSWNDFHTCASRVLLGCPEEATAVWESLQQEARRAPHPDNLHTLCGTSVHLQERGAGPETNQETLWATAPAPARAPVPPLLAAALALACLLGPLA